MNVYSKLTIAIAALAMLSGCNVGMAPAGMSREEARDALSKLPPQDQIRYYATGPMPQAEKEKKYAEIEAKYGVKASDVLGNAPAVGGGH